MDHLLTTLPALAHPAVLGALTAGIGFPVVYALVARCVEEPGTRPRAD